jgi:hypothetical protein
MAAVIIDVSAADQIPRGLVSAHIAGPVPGGRPAGLTLAARPLRSPCSDVPNPAARTAPLAAVRHECRATYWFHENPCSARRVRDTASRRQPSPARRPCRARQGCAPPSHRGARISAPPAQSRSVSAALTGRGSQVSRCAVPDAHTFAADAHGLSRPAPQAPSARWSRPVRIDVCSMFARMPCGVPRVCYACELR